jgi:hypothetical protein
VEDVNTTTQADDSGAEEQAYTLPPAFDLAAAKQAAYDAAVAEAEQPDEDDSPEPSPAETKPAEQTPSEYEAERTKTQAEADPLSKLSPDEQAAIREHVLSAYKAEQATLKELQDKASAVEKAQTTLREKFSQWLAPDPVIKAEHDELRALVYSNDPDKWGQLSAKGHDLESAIARVAALEEKLGERNERSAMSQAISEQERLTAWTEVNDAALSLTDLDGITQSVLEAGGDMKDMLRRAAKAHGDARAKAAEKEWQGKLAEQKANYERRLTRAGGSVDSPVEEGGRSGDPGSAFLAGVSKNGRLLPGVIDRALRGDFENVPLGT